MVAVPLAYYLVRHLHLGLDGILISLLVSQLLLCFLYLALIVVQTWDSKSILGKEKESKM